MSRSSYSLTELASWMPPETSIPPLPNLPDALQRLLSQVPAGKVTTYGGLARALGDVIASRWVGSFLLHDDASVTWPTHRVIRADGTMGLYAHGNAGLKAERLRAEGVAVWQERVDLKQFGVRQFSSPHPLAKLRRVQEALPEQCILEPINTAPQTIAGLDVSYIAGHMGVGGYALVCAATGELLWSTTVECHVDFPYISSFLSFRELPVLLALYAAAQRAGRLADAYVIDGAGVMHPRRTGVATHFGIACDVPTIGVTKKLLAGKFAAEGAQEFQPRDVTDEGELLGVAVRPRGTSQKFIWISPGHRMDVPTATDLTVAMLRGRRLPEPIFWADRLSRQACQRIKGTDG